VWLREVCCLGIYVWTHNFNTRIHTHANAHEHTHPQRNTNTDTQLCENCCLGCVFMFCVYVCTRVCICMYICACMQHAVYLSVSIFVCMQALRHVLDVFVGTYGYVREHIFLHCSLTHSTNPLSPSFSLALSVTVSLNIHMNR